MPSYNCFKAFTYPKKLCSDLCIVFHNINRCVTISRFIYAGGDGVFEQSTYSQHCLYNAISSFFGTKISGHVDEGCVQKIKILIEFQSD